MLCSCDKLECSSDRLASPTDRMVSAESVKLRDRRLYERWSRKYVQQYATFIVSVLGEVAFLTKDSSGCGSSSVSMTVVISMIGFSNVSECLMPSASTIPARLSVG